MCGNQACTGGTKPHPKRDPLAYNQTKQTYNHAEPSHARKGQNSGVDIPAFLTTYGGPGGLVVILLWWVIQSNKFAQERRAELREDIDREQTENKDLRAQLAELRGRVAELETENHLLRLKLLDHGGEVNDR